MLQKSRIPSDLTASMESMYINKEVLSSPVGQTNQVPAAGAADKTEICLLFLEGNCIQSVEQCFGDHYKLPYRWEVLEGHQWTLLDSSEKIEEDYCDPKITYSTVDGGAVWFETMTRGLQKVRRLSSISSVLQPTFLLTTKWLWYWEEEDGNWNQYDSPTNRALEQKFQNNPQEVVEFTAGYQAYTLSLQDMIQTNKTYITKRLVRRRPRFLSSAVVQVIRTSAGATGGAGSSAGVVATGGGERRSPPQDKIEICLLFLEGNCIDPIEKCFGAHYRLPYRWEVLEGYRWMLLDSSEKIEEDYCNPKKTYSTVDVGAVCFDTMLRRLQKVRRLSSISSVLQPTSILTTDWLWYWEDEHGNWNQYDSPPNSSTELEQKFQNNPQEVMEFTAGSQTYTLSLQDMIQTNKRHGTKRLVRRRPRFLSSAVVQDIRTRTGATGGAGSSAGVVATGGGERTSPPQDEIAICLLFLEGNCIDPIEKCFGAHYSLPYSWEVLEGHQWMLLDSSEKIEEDYCNPKITYSTVDVRVVCFKTMRSGLQKARRLSSISSVLQPTFLLTTEWLWYWEDEHGNWNQYDSPVSSGPSQSGVSLTRLTSANPNSSPELEQKFQNDPQAVVEFTAGSQTYTLSLQDMIQTNKTYSTKRLVRRRPRFLSSANVQDIRTRTGATGGAGSSAGVVATGGGERTSPPQDKIEICLFFLEGNCIYPIEKCFEAHYSLPYSWEVLEGYQWTLLDSSEKIEEDYCNPKITYSTVDVEAVCFDTMTRGPQKVRRLSSISSVLQPTFLLTTEWLWYWEDEHGNWNQYDSPPNSSPELEQKFQNDPQEVLEFTAGSQTYTLSLQDMIQTNKRYSTQRQVRRRPRFRSSSDVQDDRTSNWPPNGPSNVQAFPSTWDESQVPEIGHKKVLLQDSSKEYKEVETLFRQTMTAFDIVKIERIQNKSLWDQYQLQRKQMKTRNGGHSVVEKKLFHGTDSKFIDPICCSNFDWRICGTHGTILGKGSYFARDASYSHKYTSYASTVRSMFVSRVLVGHHTRGSADYVRPPSKDGGDTLFYDSCVDNIHSPSIFVIFDRPQIYPEFLLTYKAKAAVVGDSLSGLLVAIAAAPVVKPTPVVIPTPAVKPTPVVIPTPAVKPTPVVIPTPAVKPTPVPRTTPAQPKRMREKASAMDWHSVPGVVPEVKRKRL
ncbi:uncharacterized protein LOC132454943 isoform X3 [Gadus macrocephalus]|uniref:uncharacterized protein LOC132454943 isoform X3 n=1 Tax=Gadus macrocephalus TaxID=80720 RepID=UPI0028CB63B9|nr:uncharacterized protein LOC132454943 isoform X3 [Gadus macrocephalus]